MFVDESVLAAARRTSSASLHEAAGRIGALPRGIKPVAPVMRVCGPAFTVRCTPGDNLWLHRALLAAKRGDVLVVDTGEGLEHGYWGEIMSTAARERGCTGAVIDGGVRDLDYVNAMGYPVFARFKSSASSIGRWNIRDYQITVTVGDTVIRPGDFVFGDIDGVVIIPGEIVIDVLTAAEDVYRREGAMRDELRQGVPIKEAYAKYGSL